jgi:hypothetical protein
MAALADLEQRKSNDLRQADERRVKERNRMAETQCESRAAPAPAQAGAERPAPAERSGDGDTLTP